MREVYIPSPNPTLERSEGEECLATWWVQQTPGTTYWRCLIPARHLPGQAIDLKFTDLREDDGVVTAPRHKGKAIWQFLGDSHRSRMALWLRDQGVRTLMEVDDDYTQPPAYLRAHGQYRNWKMTIAEADGGYSFEGNRVVSTAVDGIICSTERLADVYSRYNENVFVCPNSVDPDDWQFERAEDDGVFRIVYYGSPSHVVDTPLVTKALKWAARQKDVEVWTVGFSNPGWGFAKVAPWVESLEEARKSLFRFDLGIAPLKPNPWANGKSDVKALEYAMAGVMPLVSRAEPYRPWWKLHDYVAEENGGWETAIRDLVRNRDDVRALAAAAKDYVLSERTIHDSIHLWREALDA